MSRIAAFLIAALGAPQPVIDTLNKALSRRRSRFGRR